jgi:hypothetical protein
LKTDCDKLARAVCLALIEFVDTTADTTTVCFSSASTSDDANHCYFIDYSSDDDTMVSSNDDLFGDSDDDMSIAHEPVVDVSPTFNQEIDPVFQPPRETNGPPHKLCTIHLYRIALFS